MASLVVISAPSGAGKTTVLARVLREVAGLRFSVSHTTRPPRSGERDGVDYHFVTRSEFEQLTAAGAFLEWAEVHGKLYGTSRAEYARACGEGLDLLLDVDVQGAAQVRQMFPDAVSIFLLPPSRAILEQRLRGRAPETEETIRRRLAGARAEIARFGEYDFVVVNDDIEACVATVEAIIRASRARAAGMARSARQILAGFDGVHDRQGM